MKYLLDAQLPLRAKQWFSAAGFDAIHVEDLPDSARTPDREIARVADSQGRAVVTKDADFVDSHLLNHRPEKLLLISTGNMSNRRLSALLVPLFADIDRELLQCDFVELTFDGLFVRG